MSYRYQGLSTTGFTLAMWNVGWMHMVHGSFHRTANRLTTFEMGQELLVVRPDWKVLVRHPDLLS